MVEFIDGLKIMLVVMLFYSTGVTVLAYTVPAGAQNYVTSFSDLSSEINLNFTSQKIQDSLRQQTNIPLIDLGAIVFYSGNLLIDLILNFTFAIPEMIGMLLNGFMQLIGINSYLFALVELFASIVVTIMYFIGLIQLLMNARTGRAI